MLSNRSIGGMRLWPPKPRKQAEAAAKASVDVWSKEDETSTYRAEERTHNGLLFVVSRRKLTFLEEARIVAKATDAETRRPNLLEILAETVALAVERTNFDLTPERVRNELSKRPNLAWFLINWLCADTIRNLQVGSVEDARKK